MATTEGKTARRVLAHRRVAETLEAEIFREGRPGERLPPETALAERFGVSTLTIREAVACLVEKGLVERRHGSGTYILDPRATRHVGILLNIDLRAPGAGAFWVPVAEELRRVVTAEGYRVRLYVGDQGALGPVGSGADRQELLQDVEEGQLLGLLLIGALPSEPVAAALERRRVPISGTLSSTGRHAHVEYGELLRIAFEGLAGQGCRRVGVLGWGVASAPVGALAQRVGLAWDPALYVAAPHPALPGSGYAAVRALLEAAGTDLDGLVLCDEQHLPDASLAILEAGLRVPEDLRLVSHANEGALVFSPLPLSAVVVSPRAAAANMAQVFLAELEGGAELEAQSLPAPLRWEERPAGTPKGWQARLEAAGGEGD